MQTNYVQVQFKSRFREGYDGPCYTYIADVPLQEGDIVTVPTKFGTGEARVARINVPESELKFYGELRHITEPATPNGGLFDGFI